MKTKIKCCGIITMMVIIVFSMSGCGNVTGNDDVVGSIKVVNNSGIERHMMIISTDDPTPQDTPVANSYINSGDDRTFGNISVDRDYFIAVTNRPVTAGPSDSFDTLYRSGSFSVEEGKTVTITFNGWTFY